MHRLFLASLWLALEAVQGIAGAQQMRDAIIATEDNCKISIKEAEMADMVIWMREALGVNGLMVTVDEMKQWTDRWESAFTPASLLE